MATTASVTGGEALFDPRSPEYLQDPYHHLSEARRKGPVHLDAATGLWFLLGFDEVDVGLAAITRRYDDEPNGRHVHFPDNPFAADGPGHTAPRRVIMPAFSNREVQRLRGRAQQIVDGALAGKSDGSTLRVVDEIGFPLPYHLTCDVLGVPEVDNLAELRDWTWRSLALIDAFLHREEITRNLEAAGALAAHLGSVIPWKREHMSDDVLSMVIAAGDAGEVMKPSQIIPFVHTLYLAGMHTTVNQTALSLHALLEHRSQWELLRSRPELLPNAVEELLRFEPTAQYMTRSTFADQQIGDVVIPEGSDVVAWIASANRDESRFGATADQLDIRREDARNHIAFGKGPHVCVGSWLARMELQVVVGTLIERFPNTELSDDELVWTSNVIRGPEELTLVLRT